MTLSFMSYFEGKLESLIKEEILTLLDFIDLNHCVDCIKEKYVKHIKKNGAARSSDALEIIHSEVYDPFNIRFVNDFNSFITFTRPSSGEWCHGLHSLPQSMRYLLSLRKLEIGGCHALHKLPECLGELCSLRVLKIYGLPRLSCLPESMCGHTFSGSKAASASYPYCKE
jgi:hypothetical protein